MSKKPEALERPLKPPNAVDAALARGVAGKASLAAEWHAPFDLILQAIAHYQAGRDDDARAALQGIGLQSPFLEWKVLLRGLIAYQAKDDVRALENWSRLDPTRLPCRLCAALRASIDPDFLASQPAATQQTLRTRMMQHQRNTVAPVLRDIKKILAGERFAQAFRKAEQIVPVLKRDHPDLLARLAQCFAWAVIERGEPEDLERYLRVFGAPADDPQIKRIEALALEARSMWPEAHKAWQSFIDIVAKNPAVWPGELCKRAQALLWSRMAMNASFKQSRRRSSGNPFFDLFAAHPAPLKPGPEQCLENAVKLAPDQLENYRALFELYRASNKISKAKKVGNQLLKQFPDHAETMRALGELSMDTRDYKKAQEYYEKALHANPLDQSLRFDLARAKQNYGLALTLDKKYDQARAQYEQAVHLWDGSKTSLLCQWAVVEWKANNPARAEELIARANAEPDHRLACRYALVGESVRAGLPAKQKKQFAQELKAALAEGPTPAEILVLLESAAHQRETHDDSFHGQKTQEKTILKFLDGITFDAFDERQLMRLCIGLQTLNARKPWLNCLQHGRRRFLKVPFFRLSLADYYLTERSRDPRTDLARAHLDDARRLAGEMPPGEHQQTYLEQIREREQLIAQIAARSPTFLDMMDGMFSDGPFPDDDDFYDDDDDEFW
jgi:tetratricopeptide (TPR) repeat protein